MQETTAGSGYWTSPYCCAFNRDRILLSIPRSNPIILSVVHELAGFQLVFSSLLFPILPSPTHIVNRYHCRRVIFSVIIALNTAATLMTIILFRAYFFSYRNYISL